MTRRLVVDANRLFSALLRDGETRRSMMLTGATLFAPLALRHEIERHRHEIVRRSGATEEQAETLLQILYRRISWVPDEDIQPHLAQATVLMAGRDTKDVPYLACALAVGADAIWSLDKDFDAQDVVPRTPHPDAEL